MAKVLQNLFFRNLCVFFILSPCYFANIHYLCTHKAIKEGIHNTEIKLY